MINPHPKKEEEEKREHQAEEARRRQRTPGSHARRMHITQCTAHCCAQGTYIAAADEAFALPAGDVVERALVVARRLRHVDVAADVLPGQARREGRRWGAPGQRVAGGR